MIREIPLSCFGKNKGKYVALVDDGDFDFLSQFKWTVQSNGYTLYACRRTKLHEPARGTRVFMHREIMRVGNEWQIDHVDGNGLNNTRSNLRICSPSQNAMNRHGRRNSKSGLKGVRFHKQSNNWYASIAVNGVELSLGYFGNPVDAARAYDKAAADLYGDFARLNFTK